MAVDIINTPVAFTPSDNPIVWVFKSADYANPNFSFVVKVYVNGVVDSVHEVYPERFDFSGGWGKFDAGEIMLKKCTVFLPILTELVQENQNYKKVKIEVFERYGTTPATITPGTMSDEVVAFKASLSDYQYSKWYGDGPMVGKFLTHLPETVPAEIRKLDPFLMGFLWTGTPVEIYAVIWNGASDITDFFIAVDGGGTLPGVNVLVNMSPKCLLANPSLTGLVPGSFDGATHMTFQVITPVTHVPISELRRVDINSQDCYFGRGLWWLNKYGSYDNMVFAHNYWENTAIEQLSYGRQLGDWDTSFGPILYYFDPNDAGTFDYVKNMTDKFEVTTDYLNVELYNWLQRSVLESPLVFSSVEGEEQFRILPRNGTYEEGQDRFDELFSLSVTGDIPNIRKSQTL